MNLKIFNILQGILPQLQSKKVIIFGTGEGSAEVFSALKHISVDIAYFVDNDSQKCGISIFGKVIHNPEELLNEEKDDILVLIASSADDEISSQLDKMGFIKNSDFYSIICANTQKAKNALPILVIPIVDHCNLNCKACGAYSPIVEPGFTKLSQYIRDLDRMSELFENIPRITILGGEPLLHPDINQFICSTRQFFPSSDIDVTTNGILLSKMPESFWKTLNKYSVRIEVSLYPPFAKQKENFINLAASKNVSLICLSEAKKFFKSTDLSGNNDPVLRYENCIRHVCCYLKNGEICSCGVPIVRRQFNEKFNEKIICDGVFDIHNPELTGAKLLKLLNSPFDSCKFCAEEEFFDWDVSKKQKEEWCV